MLEPGYYINMFEVKISQDASEFMIADRSRYPSLKTLRVEIEKEEKEIGVYAPARSSKVFGYGKDSEWLASKGFRKETVKLIDEPKLTGRLILEGIINKSQEHGFAQLPEVEKGRRILFNENNFSETSDGNVRIYKCYDLRVIYLKDIISNALKFYAIIDVRFLLRDKLNKSLSSREIVQFYGSNTLKEVRTIQRDFVKIGGRFKSNTEASRQRLLKDIIPFAEKIRRFSLPCRVNAELVTAPCRITMVI